MKAKIIHKRIMGLIILNFIFISSCDKATVKENKQEPPVEQKAATDKYKVTFIELGSIRCIPCQHMQIVMKSISEKYGKEVNVVFYDVWTPKGRPYGEKYGINAIPTQVFLDETGKEYFRHEGYFPEEELVKVLNMKGVK